MKSLGFCLPIICVSLASLASKSTIAEAVTIKPIPYESVNCYNNLIRVRECKVQVSRYENGEYKGFLKRIKIINGNKTMVIVFGINKKPEIIVGNSRVPLKSYWDSKKPGFLCMVHPKQKICMNTKSSSSGDSFPLH
jgi:hypothetical protein